MNYTLELTFLPDEGWFIRVKELPGCMSQGNSMAEALLNIQEAMELWLGVALDGSVPPPVPACYICKVCSQPIETTIDGELICSECHAIRGLDADEHKYDAAIEGYLSGMHTLIGSEGHTIQDWDRAAEDALNQDNSCTGPDLQMTEVSEQEQGRPWTAEELLNRGRVAEALLGTQVAVIDGQPVRMSSWIPSEEGQLEQEDMALTQAISEEPEFEPIDEDLLVEIEHLNVLRALEKARDWYTRTPTPEMDTVENAIEEQFLIESVLTAIDILKGVCE